jgi:hypothetical protein
MEETTTDTIDFFAAARKEYPTNFGATEVPRLFPGIMAVGTIYNAIHAGVGPEFRKINGRIILERDNFLQWLQSRPRIARRVSKAGSGDA